MIKPLSKIHFLVETIQLHSSSRALQVLQGTFVKYHEITLSTISKYLIVLLGNVVLEPCHKQTKTSIVCLCDQKMKPEQKLNFLNKMIAEKTKKAIQM